MPRNQARRKACKTRLHDAARGLTPVAWRMQMPGQTRMQMIPAGNNNGVQAMSSRQFPLIVALGTTQTLAWASSYYLPAILADPIAHDLGVSSNWIFAAFSASLVF